jgi:hypothetical protein
VSNHDGNNFLDQFPNGCTGPLALDLQSSAGMADCKSAMSKGGLYIQSEFDLMFIKMKGAPRPCDKLPFARDEVSHDD